jgi:FkbM family methyltransferase
MPFASLVKSGKLQLLTFKLVRSNNVPVYLPTMYAAADFLTTVNTIRLAPYTQRNRFSLLWAYLCATTNRRLSPTKQAELKLWGLKHLAPSWRIAEFLLKDVYIGAPYALSLTSAETIFDVGANCGFATLFYKATYPEAHIVAIEPQPRERALLSKAIAINKLRAVSILPCAVGATAGKAILNTHDDNSVISSMSDSRAGEGHKVEVEVATLSSILPKSPIDILKLDIEGAEVDVLRELYNSRALGPDKIRNIVMEYHRFDSTCVSALPEILSLLENSGYDYAFDAHASRSSSAQDILVYCTGKI